MLKLCRQTPLTKNTSLEISLDFEANKRQMGIDLKQAEKSTTTMSFLPLGKNYKIEFILANAVRVESRTFSLSAQTIPGGGQSSASSGSNGSGHSRASTVGTSIQMLTVVTGCLIGRLLLLEVFMAAAFILNTTAGKSVHFVRSLRLPIAGASKCSLSKSCSHSGCALHCWICREIQAQ